MAKTTREPELDESPFVFDRPVAPDQVIGRDKEARHLLRQLASGRSTCVVAPRRFGKTSLLYLVAEELRKQGHAAIVVDLFGITSHRDVLVRFEMAYRQWVTGPVRDAVGRFFDVGKLGFSLAGGGIAFEMQRQPDADPIGALHAVLDVPHHVAKRRGKRMAVILDEFQAVWAVPELDAVMRSHFQHHGQVAGYLFAGSEPSMLTGLFSDRTRPFYGQAEFVHLQRLEREPLHDAVARGFASTERSPGDWLGQVLDLADGHPQRTMLLAHHLWSAVPRGFIAEERHWTRALDGARSATRPEHEATWTRLRTNEQRVLRAIATHGSPWTKAAESAVGLNRGGTDRALRALQASGDIEPRPERGWRLIDPLLRDWITQRF